MDDLLKFYYAPLEKLLSRPDLVELSVIGDGKIGFEYAGSGYVFENHPSLGNSYWSRLCKAFANSKGLIFDPPQDCFLSLALPKGHRFQAKMGKGVDSELDISIRLFRDIDIPLEAFGLYGELKEEVLHLVKEGMNCVISGGTSSGKTTFLRQLLKHILQDKRILTLEDTREIFLPAHEHIVHHVVARNGSSEQKMLAYADEIDHMMRSRPDIIVLGEISTSNSLPILRFLNSGHAGFFTTVHANTPDLALGAAIPQNVRLSGQDDTGVEDVLRSTVDLVIQLNKHNGKRSVTEILFPKENRRITNFETQPTLKAA